MYRLGGAAATAVAAVALMAPPGGGAVDRSSSGDYIVVFTNSVRAPGRVAELHADAYGLELRDVYRHALTGYAATVPDDQIEAVAADPRVKLMDRNRQLTYPQASFRAAQSPQQVIPSGLERIEGPLSSTVAGDGSGTVDVNVAVIDSGVDMRHEDLNVRFGENCSGDETRRDPDGHGTFVAGVIAALDNDRGVVGVAPGAPIWSVKADNVRNPGTASMSKVICGVDWVTSTRTDTNPSNDIEVANLSWGDNGPDGGACGLTERTRPGLRVLHQAICRSTEAGVTYVVAAGNETNDVQREAPGNFEEVLNVTAMVDERGSPRYRRLGYCYQDETPAVFTSFAVRSDDAEHTLAAPGTCVHSTLPSEIIKGGYARADGTSFSAPYVAGAVALCIHDGPCAGLTPAQIVQKMVDDAEAYTAMRPEYGFLGDPLHTFGPCYYGYLVSARQWNTATARTASGSTSTPAVTNRRQSGVLRCQSGTQTMVLGTAAGNHLIGGDGINAINARSGPDRVSSGSAKDLVIGGRGVDRIRSHRGFDEIETGRGSDDVGSGRGDDLVSAGTGDDRVALGFGSDDGAGEPGADVLRGGRGSDLLLGEKGDDRLRGGPGADELHGGPGDDTLIGGRRDRCFDGGERVRCG